MQHPYNTILVRVVATVYFVILIATRKLRLNCQMISKIEGKNRPKKTPPPAAILPGRAYQLPEAQNASQKEKKRMEDKFK